MLNINETTFSELSSRPCGGDLWPLAMTSMEMRQLEAGSELVVLQPPPPALAVASSASPASAGHSTDDLSNCGSKLNLLEAGADIAGSCRSSSSRGLHYSNPSCDLLPASANTHQPASNEATYNAAATTSSPPHLSAAGKNNNEKSFMSRWIFRNPNDSKKRSTTSFIYSRKKMACQSLILLITVLIEFQSIEIFLAN